MLEVPRECRIMELIAKVSCDEQRHIDRGSETKREEERQSKKI
jgi:hypothetical protein